MFCDSQFLGWKSTLSLGLNWLVAEEWDIYIDQLKEVGIALNSDSDAMVWARNSQCGVVIARLAYESLLNVHLSC